jgi:predicted dehydrogenase
LRALLAANLVGDIRRLAVRWRRRAGIPRPGSWYTSKRLAGGGVLVDLGPHLLDVTLDLLGWPQIAVRECSFGPAVDWAAGASQWMHDQATAHYTPDVEIAAKLELAAADGRRVTIDAAWASDVNEDMTTIEVLGDRGRVQLDTLFGFAPGRSVAAFSGAFSAEFPLNRRPSVDFARMLRALECRSGATAHQGLMVMDIITRAYRLGTSTTSVPL